MIVWIYQKILKNEIYLLTIIFIQAFTPNTIKHKMQPYFMLICCIIHSRHSKITNFQHQGIGVDKNVGRFKITVYNICTMDVLQNKIDFYWVHSREVKTSLNTRK